RSSTGGERDRDRRPRPQGGDRRRSPGDRQAGDRRDRGRDGRPGESRTDRPRRPAPKPKPRTGFGPHGAPRTERTRRRDDEIAAPPAKRPAPLRIVGDPAKRAKASARTPAPGREAPTARRRKRRPTPDVEAEILRLGGRRGPFLLDQTMQAADAFAHDRDREALRILRPVR